MLFYCFPRYTKDVFVMRLAPWIIVNFIEIRGDEVTSRRRRLGPAGSGHERDPTISWWSGDNIVPFPTTPCSTKCFWSTHYFLSLLFTISHLLKTRLVTQNGVKWAQTFGFRLCKWTWCDFFNQSACVGTKSKEISNERQMLINFLVLKMLWRNQLIELIK